MWIRDFWNRVLTKFIEKEDSVSEPDGTGLQEASNRFRSEEDFR